MKLVRWRYLILAVISPKNLSDLGDVIAKTLRKNMVKMFGFIHYASAKLKMLYCSAERGIIVVQCSHKYLSKVRAALTLISEVEGIPVIVRTLKVTGLKGKAIEYAKSYNTRIIMDIKSKINRLLEKYKMMKPSQS